MVQGGMRHTGDDSRAGGGTGGRSDGAPGLRVTAVTREPGCHLMGYYDKCPWDASQSYLLAIKPDVMDRPPGPDDQAEIGVVDLRAGGRWIPLDRTHAWNFHTGSYAQWVGAGTDRVILYPVRSGAGYASVVRDITTGASRMLPRTPWTVSRDGRQALCIDFVRNYCLCTTGGFHHPTASAEQVWDAMPACPADDGIWWMDTETGASRLLLSLDRLAALNPTEDMRGAKHMASYIKFNPDGSRFLFAHDWHRGPHAGAPLRVYTADADGGNLHCLADEHVVISHPHWYDADRVFAYVQRPGIGDTYSLFTDRTSRVEVLWGPDLVAGDGHGSPSPDGRWIVSDTYHRTLALYPIGSRRRIDIGHFPCVPEWEQRVGAMRWGPACCHLHPRWSPDGRQVAFNSLHEGPLQVYTVDVGEITGS